MNKAGNDRQGTGLTQKEQKSGVVKKEGADIHVNYDETQGTPEKENQAQQDHTFRAKNPAPDSEEETVDKIDSIRQEEDQKVDEKSVKKDD